MSHPNAIQCKKNIQKKKQNTNKHRNSNTGISFFCNSVKKEMSTIPTTGDDCIKNEVFTHVYINKDFAFSCSKFRDYNAERQWNHCINTRILTRVRSRSFIL